MKRNDLILLIATGLYSFLFYQQTAGINFLIFNMALIACVVWRDKNVLKNFTWHVAAIGCLLSALCITLYGTAWPITANIISLCLLSALSYNAKSSVVLSLLFSVLTILSAWLFMIMDWVKRSYENTNNTSNVYIKRAGLILIPLVVMFVFFFMYRASNPLFDELAKKINFDFISWGWLLFTIMGFILLYGFFYYRTIKRLAAAEENAPDTLTIEQHKPIIFLGKELSVPEANFSGIVLFILLNTLLLIVNSLDFNYLFINHTLPKGLKYADFLHQGVGALILSIIMAIAVILFYFRGVLNFYEKNKAIKYLAYLWIVQNVCMVLSTACKNNIYIYEYGLTYKRIGVYVYLLLTLAGLITTCIKILKVKTNHFLFRINGWLFYGVLIIFCLFHWDSIITTYNISNPRSIDKYYLLDLSNSNLPALVDMEVSTQHDTTSEFDTQLNKKVFDFLKDMGNRDWRSWCYDDMIVYNKLRDMNATNKLNVINHVTSTYQGF